jgi:hypothetical protein
MLVHRILTCHALPAPKQVTAVYVIHEGKVLGSKNLYRTMNITFWEGLKP